MGARAKPFVNGKDAGRARSPRGGGRGERAAAPEGRTVFEAELRRERVLHLHLPLWRRGRGRGAARAG
jgi:hypothetical protein